MNDDNVIRPDFNAPRKREVLVVPPPEPGHTPVPPTPPTPPFLNLPPMTTALLGVFVAVQGWLSFFMSPAQTQQWYYRLGFVPRYYHDWYYTPEATFSIWVKLAPITHMFVHGGWFHLAMNGLMMVAFGAGAEKIYGRPKTALLLLISGLVAVTAQFAVNPLSTSPMIGASGALSGLFAAVITSMIATGRMPRGRFGVWGIGAVWIGLSALMAFVGIFAEIGEIAWAAHAGGFVAGALLARLRFFQPGVTARLL